MQDKDEISINSSGFVERKRGRIMNMVCGMSAALALVSAMVGSDSLPYVYSLAGLSAIFIIALGITYSGRLWLTEYFITFASTAWIVYMCIAFGSELGEQNYLIIALVALGIFSTKQTYRIVLIGLIIAVAVALNMYQRYYPPMFSMPAAGNFLFAMNVITPLAIIAVMCWNVLKDAKTSAKIIEQQKKELAESNAFKDKVFSIIGHDMRAPFNSTKSLVDLIESDLLTAEERKTTLQELRDGIDVSLQTLDNILGWASQGYYGSIINTKTKIEKLDMHALVDRTISLFVHLSERKSIRLVNEVPPQTYVGGDLEQISFVLRNLTSNALKFSHVGHDITYGARYEKGLVVISIRDTGVGMTADMLGSLFQISTRFSQEGTTKEKGTGLGLIFCKEFVENNNGMMWMESAVGKGTVANFSLQRYMG